MRPHRACKQQKELVTLLERIKALCRANKIIWTHHCLTRMLQRGISRDEVKAGLLHIVCGVTDTELWIVTAYRPDLAQWEPDFKTRKETKA